MTQPNQKAIDTSATTICETRENLRMPQRREWADEHGLGENVHNCYISIFSKLASIIFLQQPALYQHAVDASPSSRAET